MICSSLAPIGRTSCSSSTPPPIHAAISSDASSTVPNSVTGELLGCRRELVSGRAEHCVDCGRHPEAAAQ
jgi:hypothetical protein